MSFIVLALPRSRTAWMAHFLSYQGRRAGHDLLVGCRSIADFEQVLGTVSGTVETGAMLGWRVLKARLPKARLVVVKRPVAEVFESLRRLGVPVDWEELALRDQMLDLVSNLSGTLTLQYADLDTMTGCRQLFEFCLNDLSFDPEWWERLSGLNIQINMGERLAQLANNYQHLQALRAEIIDESKKLGQSQWLGLN